MLGWYPLGDLLFPEGKEWRKGSWGEGRWAEPGDVEGGDHVVGMYCMRELILKKKKLTCSFFNT